MTAPPPKHLPSKDLAGLSGLFAQMNHPMQMVMHGLLDQITGLADLFTLSRPQDRGEFQGFDGIDNRGDLGDILASEWAVYDLDKTEFIRRIAMRETLFRRRQFITKGGDRAICAIIDNGAWMLGHNRVLAMAGLFWLGAAALKENLPFYWTFHHPKPVWHKGVTRQSMGHYLGSVSQAEIDTNWVKTTFASLGVEDGIDLDAWLIGAVGLDQRLDLDAFRGAFILVSPFKDAPDAPATTSASIYTKGTFRRKITVEFPPDGLCVAAMRRPFAPETPKAKAAAISAPATYLRSTWYDDHLTMLNSHWAAVRWPGGVSLHPVPRIWSQTVRDGLTPRKPVWIPLPKGAALVALSHAANRVALVWVDGAEPTQITYFSTDLSSPETAPAYTEIDIKQADNIDLAFSPLAIPLQRFDTTPRTLNLFDHKGRPFDLMLYSGEMQVAHNRMSCLYTKGNHRVFSSSFDAPGFRVGNEGMWRNHTLSNDISSKINRQKFDLLLCTNNSDTIFISNDAITYEVIQHDRNAGPHLHIPDGLVPMIMTGPRKGYFYDPENGRVVQMRGRSIKGMQFHPRTDFADYPGLSHFCMAFRANRVCGIKLEKGLPKALVWYVFDGEHKGMHITDIVDEVSKAETICPKV
jgi:hypothetical protein